MRSEADTLHDYTAGAGEPDAANGNTAEIPSSETG